MPFPDSKPALRDPTPVPALPVPAANNAARADAPGKAPGLGEADGSAARAEADRLEHELERIVALLHRHTGRDFSDYRANQIGRRLERRMGAHRIADIPDYVRFLEANPQELDFLSGELLIGVTRFFRDPAAWDALRDQLSPRVAGSEVAERGLRAWAAGCSTGEEAYSLAIALHEAVATLRPDEPIPVKVFATDLDGNAIAAARRGLFSAGIEADLAPGRLERYFTPEAGGYRIRPEIRALVSFAPHDLLRDPPFKRLDVMCCRNVLIYLTPARQRQLLRLFHYSLAPGGLLFLGGAETATRMEELFEPADGAHRIYRRAEGKLSISKILPRSRFKARAETPAATSGESSLQSLADAFLLAHFAPSAALVNAEGDILYVNGKVEKYLDAPTGKTNWNVHGVARPPVRGALTAALQEALGEQAGATRAFVYGEGTGAPRRVRVSAHPLREPAALEGLVMIVFEEDASPRPAAIDRRPHATWVPVEPPGQMQVLRSTLEAGRVRLRACVAELMRAPFPREKRDAAQGPSTRLRQHPAARGEATDDEN